MLRSGRDRERSPREVKSLITRDRLNLAIQLISALKYLHDKKLIHRDVKPANTFLSDRPKRNICHLRLGDFGVMKWGDFNAALGTGTLTTFGQVQKGLGTLKYMSPEQALKPADVTSKSDIYSLGITLFELFTGQILASAHHVYEIANARRTRGTTMSRFIDMGYKLALSDDSMAGLILDMFLAANGRPKLNEVLGRFQHEYERRFESTWEEDLYS
jgi:serine/threonine protein kinase